MRRFPATAALLALLGGALLAQPALARNVAYHLPVMEVLTSAAYHAQVGDTTAFFFGDRAAPAGAAQLRAFVVDGKGTKATVGGDSDKAACAAAMVRALRQLQIMIGTVGGTAAVNVISLDRRVAFSSTDEYECHAGVSVVRVTLQGTAARVSR